MEEAYVACQERNTDAAYRRFLGPRFRHYPGWRQVAGFLLRHRLTTRLIVAMNALGLLVYLWGLLL